MKYSKTWLLAVIGLCLTLASGYYSVCGNVETPRTALPKNTSLFCEAPVYNAGVIDERNAVVEHSFTLTNPHKKPVRITSVKSSCGCVVADLATMEVPPRASITLPVSADWSTYVGHRKEHVTVLTDEPESQPLVLRVEGTIEPAYKLLPLGIHWGDIRPGESRTVVVKSPRALLKEGVNLLGVSCDSENVVVAEALPDDCSDRIPCWCKRITFHAPRVPGLYREVIRFRTDSKEHTILSFVIVAEVLDVRVDVGNTDDQTGMLLRY